MNTSEFITEIGEFAVLAMMRSRVLASISMAQAILESASGNHAPGNNFFGIKSTIEGTGQLLWTQEYMNGRWVQVQAWFRVYPDLEGCIEDHSDFLTVNTRYANAGFFSACDNLDYRAAAKALQTAGYATDPRYAQSLMTIIEDNKLYLFDKEAFNSMQIIDDLQKRVAALESRLAKTSAPDWFITEFGPNALSGIVNDLTGDENFWRNTAVSLRIAKKFHTFS